MQPLNIPSEKELEFALFCVDYVARELHLPPDEIYRKLEESGLLQNYIIDSYGVLHTQGREYIVADIISVMKERGVL